MQLNGEEEEEGEEGEGLGSVSRTHPGGGLLLSTSTK